MIRVAKLKDCEALLEIYKPYILDTAITFEYIVPSIEEFRLRIKNTLEKYPYIVYIDDGKILGYAYASCFKNREAYDHSVETSIYVDNNYKGKGIGKALYNELERYLKAMNIINVNACIAYTNQDDEYLNNDSVKFHEHLGYKIVGHFHNSGYKFKRWYDMVWMEKFLNGHDKVKDVIWFKELIKE